MLGKHPKYPMEEFARRGEAIYDERIRPVVEKDHKGDVVAIDIESGDWEIDRDEDAACDRLDQRHTNAQIWMIRVGFPALRQRRKRSEVPAENDAGCFAG